MLYASQYSRGIRKICSSLRESQRFRALRLLGVGVCISLRSLWWYRTRGKFKHLLAPKHFPIFSSYSLNCSTYEHCDSVGTSFAHLFMLSALMSVKASKSPPSFFFGFILLLARQVAHLSLFILNSCLYKSETEVVLFQRIYIHK